MRGVGCYKYQLTRLSPNVMVTAREWLVNVTWTHPAGVRTVSAHLGHSRRVQSPPAMCDTNRIFSSDLSPPRPVASQCHQGLSSKSPTSAVYSTGCDFCLSPSHGCSPSPTDLALGFTALSLAPAGPFNSALPSACPHCLPGRRNPSRIARHLRCH